MHKFDDDTLFRIIQEICATIPEDAIVESDVINYALDLIISFLCHDSVLISAIIALDNELPAFEADGITPYKNAEMVYKYLFYFYKELGYDETISLIEKLSVLC